MQTFNITPDVLAVCEWKKTRNAFKHVATLIMNGREIESVKICYQNRTWERYTYESVLQKLQGRAEKFLTPELSERFKNKIETQWRREDDENTAREFGAIATIAKMGAIFADTIENVNDWKARMLQAGLTGLELPEDWNELSEDEKTKRLDNVINSLTATKND